MLQWSSSGVVLQPMRACLVCCVFCWSSCQMQKVTTRIRRGSFEENMNTGESPRSLMVQSKRWIRIGRLKGKARLEVWAGLRINRQ